MGYDIREFEEAEKAVAAGKGRRPSTAAESPLHLCAECGSTEVARSGDLCGPACVEALTLRVRAEAGLGPEDDVSMDLAQRVAGGEVSLATALYIVGDPRRP